MSNLFYVMMQDDGSIVAYCAKNNHPRELVNVPELTRVILMVDGGLSKDDIENIAKRRNECDATPAVQFGTPEGTPFVGRGKRHVYGSDEHETKTQGKAPSDDSISINGAHADTGLPSEK